MMEGDIRKRLRSKYGASAEVGELARRLAETEALAARLAGALRRNHMNEPGVRAILAIYDQHVKKYQETIAGVPVTDLHKPLGEL